ncbi:hypothetical protein MKK88_12610 [Methylobacterium sp. E-005]|nr:hypothetical protein [Methylobacterium sp. E-005]MCJ2086828.1 hypothetical protein [Methylobacterium sp. E-005]
MIARGLRNALKAHMVTIGDDAVVPAADLSDRDIAGRVLSDRAIA